MATRLTHLTIDNVIDSPSKARLTHLTVDAVIRPTSNKTRLTNLTIDVIVQNVPAGNDEVTSMEQSVSGISMITDVAEADFISSMSASVSGISMVTDVAEALAITGQPFAISGVSMVTDVGEFDPSAKITNLSTEILGVHTNRGVWITAIPNEVLGNHTPSTVITRISNVIAESLGGSVVNNVRVTVLVVECLIKVFKRLTSQGWIID